MKFNDILATIPQLSWLQVISSMLLQLPDSLLKDSPPPDSIPWEVKDKVNLS